MPKIPTYDPQVQPSESSKPLIQDPGSVGYAEKAWQKAGAIVSDRAQKYQEEKDILAASDALTNFGDEERAFQTEYSQKQGLEAEGGQQRGNEFYAQAIEKHSATLSRNAADIFRKKALQYREYGLDRMAGHEAQQHQKAKQATFDKLKTQAEQNIRAGATEPQVLQQIDDLKSHIRELHRGIDTTDMEDQLESNLLKAFLVEQAGMNPRGTPGLLERYSTKIDEATKSQINDFAEKKEVEQSVDQYSDILRSENGNDYAKIMNAIPSLPISDKAKKTLKTRMMDEYHTEKMFKDLQKKEGQDRTLNTVVNKYAAGDFAGVRKMILDDNNLEPHQREHWLDKLEARERAIDTGKDNEFNKSDPEVRGRVLRAVMEHPEQIQGHQIWQFHGNGLSTDACKEIQGILVSINKGQDTHIKNEAKRASELVEAWRKAGDLDSGWFGDGPKSEKSYMTKLKILDGVNEFIRKYPDKDVVDDFLVPYREELKRQSIDEAFEKFYSKKPKPKPVKVSIPKGKKQIDDDKFYSDWLGHNPFLEVK